MMLGTISTYCNVSTSCPVFCFIVWWSKHKISLTPQESVEWLCLTCLQREIACDEGQKYDAHTCLLSLKMSKEPKPSDVFPCNNRADKTCPRTVKELPTCFPQRLLSRCCHTGLLVCEKTQNKNMISNHKGLKIILIRLREEHVGLTTLMHAAHYRHGRRREKKQLVSFMVTKNSTVLYKIKSESSCIFCSF